MINGVVDNDPGPNGSGLDNEVMESESECGKKKKKRVKKKKESVKVEDEVKKDKKQVVCLYPFTTSSSATQRKIKQHYDQLVKSHQSNALTLAQVIFCLLISYVFGLRMLFIMVLCMFYK